MKRNVFVLMTDRYTVDANGCWIWNGKPRKDGYCKIKIQGKTYYAHIISYKSAGLDIPEGYTLDHLCRVRNCVNPAHLEPVTQKVNTARGISVVAVNMKKTHCNAGHEFTPENTREAKGKRHCRKCCA